MEIFFTIILSALLAAQLIFWLDFHRKTIFLSLFTPIEGYLLINLGAYIYLIGQGIEDGESYLNYLKSIGASLGIIGIHFIFNKDWIQITVRKIRVVWEISKYLSGIMIGVILHYSNSQYLSSPIAFDNWLIIIPLLWSFTILYLLVKTHDLGVFFKEDVKPLLIAKYLAIFGLVLLFSSAPFIFTKNYVLNDLLINYGIFLIFLSITLYFYLVSNDPENAFNFRTQYNLLINKGRFSYAFFTYETTGPKLHFFNGFNFLNDREKEEYLIRLGISGLVLLGRGDQYIEGSVILPIEIEYGITCLGITFWIDDNEQSDERFNNRTFCLLLLAIDRSLERIFAYRKRWEKIIYNEINEFNAKKKRINQEEVDYLVKRSIRQILLREQVKII